ncbi:MAG: hypothetical protein Q9227_005070 [Pyrenula ochraceoflavens]
MPREKKKRGRREERKRKVENRLESPTSKRRKFGIEEEFYDAELASPKTNHNADYIAFTPHLTDEAREFPFYGLLDEQEQNYYADVNSKLELSDFESEDDRRLFIEAVYRESAGKELKLACSQSCSRYLERLILLSSPSQLKELFKKFRGHFIHLVQHRFASHCSETLFVQCAPLVTSDPASRKSDHDPADDTSMENLFLQTIDELENDVGYLLTEKFASHSLRVLLAILSGEPLNTTNTKAPFASRKKESVDKSFADKFGSDIDAENRNVPRSFRSRLDQLKDRALIQLSTSYIQALATHPVGNPVLQLLLQIEASQHRKSKSVDDLTLLNRLFPAWSFEEDSENARFVLGLLYDPTGSRLTEVVVQTSPGKFFKKLYPLLRSRLPSMIKNEVSSYVAIRIFERLGKDDLQKAVQQTVADIPLLLAKRHFAVISVLVERVVIRGVDPHPLADAIRSKCIEHGSTLVWMLGMDADCERGVGIATKPSPLEPKNSTGSLSPDVHGALFAQTLCKASGFADIPQSAVLAIPPPLIYRLCKDPVASRVFQEVLTSDQSGRDFRRQLIPKFYDQIVDLSIDTSGSHVVDALWFATGDLYFMKEQIAQVLASHESDLRDQIYGRAVWRNWRMDVYNTRRRQWIGEAKASNPTASATNGDGKKTALVLAKERYIAEQRKPQKRP